jgi:hypothetical protein
MHKKLLILPAVAALAVAFIISCKPEKQVYTDSLALSVTNSSISGTDEIPVIISFETIRERKPDFNPKACAVLFRQAEIPFQINDLNGDSLADELVFMAVLGPSETRDYTLAYNPSGTFDKNFPKRTQAELSIKTGGEWKDRKYIGGTFGNVSWLRVPAEQTDHTDYIRYEGPGWESDKIGYRFYLDWRNATDIFGKLTDTMVLQNVGQVGAKSYHELAPWGMDVFKVGETLGIGSVGMWQNNKVSMVSVTDSVTCRIALNGDLQSQVETNYYGWKVGDKKYKLVSDLAIFAGSRLTRHDLMIDDPACNLCTGIILNDSVVVVTNNEDTTSQYVYFGTWGWQSLNKDNLGLGIIVNRNDLQSITTDKMSHVLVFKSGLTSVRYYFLAAWEKEPGGIRSSDDFRDYLDKTAAGLAGPLQITFK